MNEFVSNKQVDLKLKSVSSTVACYEVRIDGSDAVAEFSIRSDDFGNLFDSERFKHSVLKSIERLHQFDPEYHGDYLNEILNVT